MGDQQTGQMHPNPRSVRKGVEWGKGKIAASKQRHDYSLETFSIQGHSLKQFKGLDEKTGDKHNLKETVKNFETEKGRALGDQSTAHRIKKITDKKQKKGGKSKREGAGWKVRERRRKRKSS